MNPLSFGLLIQTSTPTFRTPDHRRYGLTASRVDWMLEETACTGVAALKFGLSDHTRCLSVGVELDKSPHMSWHHHLKGTVATH